LDTLFSEKNWEAVPLKINSSILEAEKNRVEYQAFLAPYIISKNGNVFMKFNFDYDLYSYSINDGLVEKNISFSNLYPAVKFPNKLDGSTEGMLKIFYSNLFVEGFGQYKDNFAIVYTETVDPEFAPSSQAQARDFIKKGRVIHFFDYLSQEEKIFNIPDYVSGTNFMFYKKYIIFMSQDNAVDGKMLYIFENPMSV